MNATENKKQSLVNHLETLVNGVKNQINSDFNNNEVVQQDLILIISTAVELSDVLGGEEQK